MHTVYTRFMFLACSFCVIFSFIYIVLSTHMAVIIFIQWKITRWTPSTASFLSGFWSDHHVVLWSVSECTMVRVWFSVQMTVICFIWLQLISHLIVNESVPFCCCCFKVLIGITSLSLCCYAFAGEESRADMLNVKILLLIISPWLKFG